jgi:hypothetical protein
VPAATPCHPECHESEWAFPGQPGDGWQQRTLPALARLAAQDARISDFRVHGSASGAGAAIDRWSDLDVLITAAEPPTAAEDLAREIGRHLSPVYAAERGADHSAYIVRLALSDLRRIDITATAPAGGEHSPASAAQKLSSPDLIGDLIGTFKFEAVLAALKAARHDVLIGAHLTLQLARHVLVIAMLLRDREAGNAHHRYGGSRWDAWASHLGEGPPLTLRPRSPPRSTSTQPSWTRSSLTGTRTFNWTTAPCSNCWTRSTSTAPRSNSPERANTRHMHVCTPLRAAAWSSCPPT